MYIFLESVWLHVGSVPGRRVAAASISKVVVVDVLDRVVGGLVAGVDGAVVG